MNSKNMPSTALFRKLSHLIGQHPGEIRRRDLRSARESEVQLELDLTPAGAARRDAQDLAVIR